eukprot:TRINITY_DN845_c0_g1_i1.p1 TRINITY_DN845_c0_g1~~TRINITY_DN845_c0_g1_i1.p1  ORF type:complete len:239 (-),score=46.35 TRINITY_DN845_c0_g1_i1:149-865(-)
MSGQGSTQYAAPFVGDSGYAPNQNLVRGTLLFHSIDWVIAFIASRLTLSTISIQTWHSSNWGVAVAVALIWAGIILAVGCGGRAFRVAPLHWLAYALFTFLTLYLASAATVFFNGVYLYYVIAAFAGITVANTIYAFTTRQKLSLAGAALFILAGVSVFYIIFIIFYDIALRYLIIVGIIILLLGFFQLYDATEIIAGTAYGLEGGQSVAGAILLWLDYILIPVRLLEAFTRGLRNRN